MSLSLPLATAIKFFYIIHSMRIIQYKYNGSAVIYAVRTSGEKFISSLHCFAKKEKSKRVPELGGRELTYLSPDVFTHR